jgi:DNA-binding NarL/FixJ family response regulator
MMEYSTDITARRQLRLALIDDHLLFRQGFRALLAGQPDMLVVADGTDLEGMTPSLEEAAPDLAIVDIMLRGSCGIAITHEVLRRAPHCRVMILTLHGREEVAASAFAAGASGYALKDQDAAEVMAGIRKIGGGGRYVAPALPRDVLDQPAAANVHACLAQLSPREKEVFDLIVAGRSNRDAADRLSISIKTIEAHRAGINRKLDAHSTADLVRIAARHGLMPI